VAPAASCLQLDIRAGESFYWALMSLLVSCSETVSPLKARTLCLLPLWSQRLDQNLPQSRCSVTGSGMKERMKHGHSFLAQVYTIRASEVERLWATTGRNIGTSGLVVPEGFGIFPLSS